MINQLIDLLIDINVIGKCIDKWLFLQVIIQAKIPNIPGMKL